MTFFNCPFDNLLMLDVSTTAEEDNLDFPPEIIQMSVVVLDVKEKRIREDVSFDAYSKPSMNPKLTDYCIAATGVTQENVDGAASFQEVYLQFLAWLELNGFKEKTFTFAVAVSDTIWVKAQYQLLLLKTPIPGMFRQWIDIPKLFMFLTKESDVWIHKNHLQRMATFYGVVLEGDRFDSRSNAINIARISMRILDSGARVTINTVLDCFFGLRNLPMNWNKGVSWQKDPRIIWDMRRRIMPLTFRWIEYKTDAHFGKCSFCKLKPDECTGLIHKQYPDALFEDLKQTSRPVSKFAVLLEH